MEEMLRSWDGEGLTLVFDKQTRSWIIIAIHSSVLGPAAGGTRMKTYASLEEAVKDAQRLAEGMTYKWAAAGSVRGGGKAVLFVPPDQTAAERKALFKRYGHEINNLGGRFYTGPDLGTSTEDMDFIGQFAPDYVFGRSSKFGGAGDPAPFTALGIFTAMEVTAQHLVAEPLLENWRIVIQGAGNVGRSLAKMLQEVCADVLCSDINAQSVRFCTEVLGLTFIPADEIYETHCDIFAPCAVGGVINHRTIPRFNCKAIVGGANNQLARPQDAESLRARGILYAPDFIANCGGAIAITEIEAAGWSAEKAAEVIRSSVRDNLTQIFELSSQQDISTNQAAHLLAEMRIESKKSRKIG
jgi:leucine dehydrogenase